MNAKLTPVIKPIETRYNGYRFRSRLEARWAVFFDSMGIEYRYESEGYDLGELGWYLPDFYLPETRQYIGIKPKEDAPACLNPLKIYCAGEVHKDGWHTKLHTPDIDLTGDLPFEFPVSKIPGSAHLYVGPYFTNSNESKPKADDPTGMDSYFDYRIREKGDLSNRYKAISDCDVFYAHIDHDEGYKTFLEIGFALGLSRRPKIYVNTTMESAFGKDMWFVIHGADRNSMENDPIEGLKRCMNGKWDNETTKEERQIKLLGEAKNAPSSRMYYGDPVDNIDLLAPQRSPKLMKAALAARGARFEHGE